MVVIKLQQNSNYLELRLILCIFLSLAIRLCVRLHYLWLEYGFGSEMEIQNSTHAAISKAKHNLWAGIILNQRERQSQMNQKKNKKNNPNYVRHFVCS